jgi:WD40 repeat protein
MRYRAYAQRVQRRRVGGVPAHHETRAVALSGHKGTVSPAALSRDGSRIVTGSDDNTARTWDATSAREIAILRGHDGTVWSAALGPDGSRIVTASLDHTARIWDAVTGREIAVLRGHENSVRSAAFSPDASRIVTAPLRTRPSTFGTSTSR